MIQSENESIKHLRIVPIKGTPFDVECRINDKIFKCLKLLYGFETIEYNSHIMGESGNVKIEVTWYSMPKQQAQLYGLNPIRKQFNAYLNDGKTGLKGFLEVQEIF